MLAVARGLMSQPVLLLDEPSLGLAPKVIEELFTALDTLRNEGLTVLLVDQMGHWPCRWRTGPMCWRRAASWPRERRNPCLPMSRC